LQLDAAISKHVLEIGMRSFAPTVVFAEVPVGSQSSRAMCSYGVCIGLLAGLAARVPLIQVQPTEVKLAAVGTKTASKEEMIEWATGLYPQLPWFTTKRKGVTTFSAKNEHIADAIAAIYAGILTDEFKRMIAMWKVATAGSLAA
jgi:Holliday junction resolvasome RuvABC endonuclease subunit